MTSVEPPQTPEGAPNESRLGPVAKGVLVSAIVLPFAALATCASDMGGGGGSVGWGVGIFGLGVLAGLASLLIFADGRDRRLSGLAVALNAAGIAANVMYFLSQLHFTRGRQIRGPGGQVLPHRPTEPPARAPSARAARAWRGNGDTEAASVSAFAMLSLDLAELGAPLALTRATHDDALDEIRHAELCYGLARANGDVAVGLAPMPRLAAVRGRACSLSRVAVESFVEGAYLEAVSANIALAMRDLVADDATRAVLDVISVDEARHAEHAWAVVSWCHQADRATVGVALGEALARVPVPEPPHDDLGSDGSLEALGIPGRDLQRAIATRCLSESKTRLALLLAA